MGLRIDVIQLDHKESSYDIYSSFAPSSYLVAPRRHLNMSLWRGFLYWQLSQANRRCQLNVLSPSLAPIILGSNDYDFAVGIAHWTVEMNGWAENVPVSGRFFSFDGFGTDWPVAQGRPHHRNYRVSDDSIISVNSVKSQSTERVTEIFIGTYKRPSAVLGVRLDSQLLASPLLPPIRLTTWQLVWQARKEEHIYKLLKPPELPKNRTWTKLQAELSLIWRRWLGVNNRKW